MPAVMRNALVPAGHSRDTLCVYRFRGVEDAAPYGYFEGWCHRDDAPAKCFAVQT